MNHKNIHDVAILGLGAMGSAALYQLSQQDVDVVGIDQFNPPHNLLGQVMGNPESLGYLLVRGSRIPQSSQSLTKFGKNLKKRLVKNFSFSAVY